MAAEGVADDAQKEDATVKTSHSPSTGIGLPTILFVVFLVLKLTGHIDWSWWWVTAPLWGPLAFVLVGTGVIYAYFGIRDILDGIEGNRKFRQLQREFSDEKRDAP